MLARRPMNWTGAYDSRFLAGEVAHYKGHLRDAFLATLEDYLVGKSGSLDGF